MTRIVTASDCVPTFPAISKTIDWKNTMAGKTAITVSNVESIIDTTSPKNISAINQGSLFFIDEKVDSSRSSFSVKPPSLA